MPFYNKQIPFIASSKRIISIGFILCLFLSFIIIFLQPFDTNNYTPQGNKTLILLGFGVLLFCVLLVHSLIEALWYKKVSKVWLMRYEAISISVFFLISGSVIYLYNHIFINGLTPSINSYAAYFKNIVLVFIPVVAPLLLFLRYKYGELIIPLSKNDIIITGENKNELLTLKKQRVLYIKAVENYIEIHYLDTDKNVKSKTFRQTLSKAHQQAPFLEKCHRSYLVNIAHINLIHGNSQNAKISFVVTEEKIPLSKTLFKNIKDKLVLP